MRYPLSKKRGNQGVNYVRTTVNNCGAIFRDIGESDVGIDGYIEFVDSEEATGFVVGVQIKSGHSYVDTNKKEYIIPTNLSHLRYWSDSSIPIVGIVYDITRNTAGWVDLSKFASEHIKKNIRHYTIRFPWSSQFDENTFIDSFRNALEPYRVRSKISEILDSISSSDNSNRLLGALALRQHRTNKIACFMFSNLLRDSDIEIRRIAIVWFSTYFPHPDILWGGDFMPASGELREYASFLANNFDRCVIQSMLEAIDEEGVDRGTLGQCVDVILNDVPQFVDYLPIIAADDNLSNWIRANSIVFLGLYGLADHRPLIEGLKGTIDDPYFSEAIEWTLDAFNQSTN